MTVHFLFDHRGLNNFSYFGTVIMVIYKRMAGKRQETIPLLAGCGIPLTATGLALLCSSYYVLIGEQCMEKNAEYPMVRFLA